MANPNISQGNINRLKASVIWNDFPALNVTAPFLGKEGIRLAFLGKATVFIDAMTGRVTSPEPYLGIALTINLLKSQQLSDAYKVQQELSSLLGDGTIRPDAKTLSPYQISNCAIEGVNELSFNGETAGYQVLIGGTYFINSSLWN